MAYTNNYGFNLGIRTGVLRDLDRGQRPEKYISLSDPSYNHSEEGLGRFNFDSGNINHIRGGTLRPTHLLQQQQQQQFRAGDQQTPEVPHYLNQNPNVIPLHLADLSRPPPVLSRSFTSNPVPPNTTSIPYQPNWGGSFTPLSESINDNEEEYEGMILV